MRGMIAAGGASLPEPPPPGDIFLNPFNHLSPFRRPIGTGAQYAGSTHAMTVAWNRLGFNNISTNTGNGFNVFRNKPSDPIRTINWYGGGGGANLPITVRAPVMRNPYPTGTEHDSPTILFDTVGSSRAGAMMILEFSRFRGSESPWTARDCNIINPYGDGRDAGASASDIAGSGLGLYTWELDPDAGPIRKACGITLNAQTSPAQLKAQFVWPAKHIDASCGGGYACDGPIPYGTLVALPPSVNINSLGLTPLGLRLAAMLRDYGWYAVDNGGRNMRTDQSVPTSVQTDMRNSFVKLWPLLRAVLNNESTATQPTCSGGGTPIAPNGAYDA